MIDMFYLIICLLTLNAGLLIGLLWRQHRAQRALQTLSAQMKENPAARTSTSLNAGQSRLIVEVLNPLELAAKESWFAGKLGGIAPTLIRKEVYKVVRDRMATQLAAEGVQADLQVQHG